MSLFELGKNLLGVQRELHARADLGNDVVVVGVEPLSHFQWRDVPVATGGSEIAVEVVGDGLHPCRQRAQQDSGVQHLVVVGEGIHRHGVQAGGGQLGPGVVAQGRGDLLEL
jgi:hypothetical protein